MKKVEIDEKRVKTGIHICYHCFAASEVIFMTCPVLFIFQCDKKEMRKNYMQTKRFKVSNCAYVQVWRYFVLALQSCCILFCSAV